MKTMIKCAVAALLAAAATGAAAQQRIDRPGTIAHAAADAHFPERVGEFRRGNVHQYDEAGRDISATYNLVRPTGRIVLSIYIYPASRLGQTDGAEQSRVALCGREFDGVRGAIEAQNAGALKLHQGTAPPVAGIEPGLSHRAVYRFTAPFDGERQEVRSEADLYCFVGSDWLVKYRITAPAGLDIDADLDRFIRTGPWPGRPPAPQPDEMTQAEDGTEAGAG
jgi:hypothetical protein